MQANFALQDRFLGRFFASPLAEHFYLTGGTALARFYYNHRESLDLDLFTNDFGQDFAQVNQIFLQAREKKIPGFQSFIWLTRFGIWKKFACFRACCSPCPGRL